MWNFLSEKLGVSAALCRRLAVNAAAVAVVVAGGFLPVPTAEIEAAQYYGLQRHPLMIGAFGLVPFAIGFVLAEAVAAVKTGRGVDLAFDADRPSWIPRLAVLAGIGIAVALSLETAAYLFALLPSGLEASLQSGSGWSELRVAGTAASIAAGSGLYYLAARWVSRSGLGDGFAVVIGTGIAWEIVPASREFGDWLRGMSMQNLDVFGVLGNALAVATVILATLWAVARYEGWVVRRGVEAGDSHEGDGSILRSRQSAATPFHLPAAGVVPFAVGTSLLWGLWLGRTVTGTDPIDWMSAGLETIPHASTIPVFFQELAVVLAVGALFNWWFVGGDAERGDASEEERRRRIRRAHIASLGFLAGLVTLDVFGGALVRSVGVVNLVIGTAVAFDLAGEWRFRRTFPEVVPIGRLHRTGAVGPVVERLTTEGIPTFVRGRAFRGMLRIFGSFTPNVVLVPASCRDSAEEALEAERVQSSDGNE